jgi:hypothetical protein
VLEQVGDPGESQLRFGRGGAARERPETAFLRTSDHRSPQRGLADSRFTDDVEHRKPLGRGVEERIGEREFALATDDLGHPVILGDSRANRKLSQQAERRADQSIVK